MAVDIVTIDYLLVDMWSLYPTVCVSVCPCGCACMRVCVRVHVCVTTICNVLN